MKNLFKVLIDILLTDTDCEDYIEQAIETFDFRVFDYNPFDNKEEW